MGREKDLPHGAPRALNKVSLVFFFLDPWFPSCHYTFFLFAKTRWNSFMTKISINILSLLNAMLERSKTKHTQIVYFYSVSQKRIRQPATNCNMRGDYRGFTHTKTYTGNSSVSFPPSHPNSLHFCYTFSLSKYTNFIGEKESFAIHYSNNLTAS